MTGCPVFWGSHGCDLERYHTGLHWCRSCCRTDEEEHVAGHVTAPDSYGWDGCAGSWPYYGSKHMRGATEHGLGFFTYEAPDWQFVYLPDEFDRMATIRGSVAT